MDLPARVEDAIGGTAAPEAARSGFERLLERVADPARLVERLDDVALARGAALLGLGGAVAEALVSSAEDLAVLGAGALPDPPPVPKDAAFDALRALRRRYTLLLAARELTGELEATAAAAHLSALAEALLERALERVRAELRGRHPEVASLRLAVLALGKLGGGELNYSSDVDLVLLRADDAPAAPAEALARAFVAAVGARSARGHLFRVDLRLRPYGSAGALVPRASAFRAYYPEAGRTWERQALLKARPVAGDRELGAEALADLAPWLWRDELDARAIQEVLGLRERIAARAPGAERDVKLGPGGLRDVEFAVQFLQLLHGGRDPRLRTPHTREAIARLTQRRFLRGEEALALDSSYCFLRRLEHLLQLVSDRERTQLPEGEELALLARCLRRTPAELEAAFQDARRCARTTLDALLRRPFAPVGARALDLRDLLLGRETAPERAARLLEAEGFRDGASAWRHLRSMAEEKNPLWGPSGRARTVLAGLAPRLLARLARAPDPDAALRNLDRLTAPLGAKATVFELFAENDDAFELLCALAAGSDALVVTCANHPEVFDEVVDRLLTGAVVDPHAVRADASATLAARGPEALRELRALYLLWIGMPDLAGRANVQNTARALADVAEGFLGALVERAREVVRERGELPAEGEFLVLGLGRLGARELSYGSDLDLVLLSEGPAPAAAWEPLAGELLALARDGASAEGPLLPLDLRLRPGGRSAPLVRSLSGALAYWRGEGPGDRARDAERLALQKARPVCGSERARARLAAALAGVLYERSYGAELWDELTEIRARQVAATAPDDLKRGPGGLADIELVASALALRYGGERPGLREPNTARLLAALEAEGLLDPAEHRELRTAYAMLRRVLLRLRVRTWQPHSQLPAAPEVLRGLALALGYRDVGAARAEGHLREELAHVRARARAVCAQIVARERSR
ncbi:MAG: hypothetical protein D6731_07590 [Planctomycetota bacterium]|nr:MAG: hypothetical protein D6731_07590 [Planctomycetota bacterium]